MEPGQSSTTELVQRAARDIRDLVGIELELAKRELGDFATMVKGSLVAGAVAAIAAILALGMFAIAIFLAAGATPLAALAVGIGLLTIAALGFVLAARMFPSNPLPRTKRRIERDLKEIKEAVAS